MSARRPRVVFARWIALAFAATTLGCATGRAVTTGMLTTPGSEIRNTNFTIKSGVLFDAPYSMDIREFRPDTRWTERYVDAVGSGAHRVRVTVPGLAQPLFGVLALYRIPTEASGPGARSYSIQIPQQYVDQASDGKISVIYELVPVREKRFVTWMLWMSDRQF